MSIKPWRGVSMERLRGMKKIGWIVLFAPLLLAINLVEPPPREEPTVQQYPESSFGQAPADPITGQPRQVMMEEWFPQNRKPAGLVVGEDISPREKEP